MQVNPKILFGSMIVAIAVSYSIGKNSTPAKVEVKTVEVEKLVYVETSSKAVSGTKKSSSVVKPDGTKIEKSEETFGSVESSNIDLSDSKVASTETTVKSGVFGVYGGFGVRLSEPLKKPYLSGVLTYENLAFTVQSDLKLDHRIAGHIGIVF